MRLLLLLVCFGAVACAKPMYRDVNGEPVALYWQCREGSPNPVMYERGRQQPCPGLSEVWCPDGNGGHERFVIANMDQSVHNSAQPPGDADAMCARIRRH